MTDAIIRIIQGGHTQKKEQLVQCQCPIRICPNKRVLYLTYLEQFYDFLL